MNDKELADRVVALGVGRCDEYPYYQNGDNHHDLTEDQFVRDWQVAGAMMEKVRETKKGVSHGKIEDLTFNLNLRINDVESLPRAINETCSAKLERD